MRASVCIPVAAGDEVGMYMVVEEVIDRVGLAGGVCDMQLAAVRTSKDAQIIMDFMVKIELPCYF